MIRPTLKAVPRLSLLPLRVVALALLALSLATAHPAFAGKEPKKRVAVTAFENQAGYAHPQWGDVGRGLATRLIDALMTTDKFIVVEREALGDIVDEQNLGQIVNVAPGEESRVTTAQALIRGAITSIEEEGGDKGGFRIKKLRVGGGRQTVVVKLNIRVIDTTTGQLLESKSVEGVAKQRKLILRRESDSYEGKRNTPLSDAIDDAIAKAVEGITAGMDKVPWQGSVVRVSGRQVFINAGYQENVEEGMRLRVFEKGIELIDTETNENLGRLDEEIGIIELIQVAPLFSVARIVQGQGFAKGNVVKPVRQFSTAELGAGPSGR